MPIPHQTVLHVNPEGIPFPVPELPGELETYPFEDAVDVVETSAANWQGVAQVFDLRESSAQFSDPFVWVEFYSELPAVAGYRFKVGLYKRTSNTSSTLVAMSETLTSVGSPGGFKRVKLLPYNSQTVSITAGETYQIALYTSQNPNGKFVFRCKEYMGSEDYASNHITYPPSATVETSDDTLSRIEYGSWISAFYIWFSVSRAATSEYEVLP